MFEVQACTSTSDTVCDSCSSPTGKDHSACIGVVDSDVADMYEMMQGDDHTTLSDEVNVKPTSGDVKPPSDVKPSPNDVNQGGSEVDTNGEEIPEEVVTDDVKLEATSSDDVDALLETITPVEGGEGSGDVQGDSFDIVGETPLTEGEEKVIPVAQTPTPAGQAEKQTNPDTNYIFGEETGSDQVDDPHDDEDNDVTPTPEAEGDLNAAVVPVDDSDDDKEEKEATPMPETADSKDGDAEAEDTDEDKEDEKDDTTPTPETDTITEAGENLVVVDAEADEKSDEEDDETPEDEVDDVDVVDVEETAETPLPAVVTQAQAEPDQNETSTTPEPADEDKKGDDEDDDDDGDKTPTPEPTVPITLQEGGVDEDDGDDENKTSSAISPDRTVPVIVPEEDATPAAAAETMTSEIVAFGSIPGAVLQSVSVEQNTTDVEEAENDEDDKHGDVDDDDDSEDDDDDDDNVDTSPVLEVQDVDDDKNETAPALEVGETQVNETVVDDDDEKDKTEVLTDHELGEDDDDDDETTGGTTPVADTDDDDTSNATIHTPEATSNETDDTHVPIVIPPSHDDEDDDHDDDKNTTVLPTETSSNETDDDTHVPIVLPPSHEDEDDDHDDDKNTTVLPTEMSSNETDDDTHVPIVLPPSHDDEDDDHADDKNTTVRLTETSSNETDDDTHVPIVLPPSHDDEDEDDDHDDDKNTTVLPTETSSNETDDDTRVPVVLPPLDDDKNDDLDSNKNTTVLSTETSSNQTDDDTLVPIVLPPSDDDDVKEDEEKPTTSSSPEAAKNDTESDVVIPVGSVPDEDKDDDDTAQTSTPFPPPTSPEPATTDDDDDSIDIVVPVGESSQTPSTTQRIPTLEEVESTLAPEEQVVDIGSGEVPGIVVGGDKGEEPEYNVTGGAGPEEKEGGVDVVIGVGVVETTRKTPGHPGDGTRHGEGQMVLIGEKDNEDAEVEETNETHEHLEIESSHQGDTEEDMDSKKRTALIVGVAVGGVALFAIGFFTTRHCKNRRKFKVMKKVEHGNGPMDGKDEVAIEFRPLHGGSGIYDEVDEVGNVSSNNGSYRKVKEGGYTPVASSPATFNTFTAPSGDTYAVVNKKRKPPPKEDVHDPHVNGIDKIRYMDETTDEEGGEPTVHDRLLPPTRPHAALPEVEEEESKIRPPEPEKQASTSGDSQTSLSTDVIENLEKKMANGGSSEVLGSETSDDVPPKEAMTGSQENVVCRENGLAQS
ncbi:dentin sialophosphoprotein-like [Littorina saxatilis]|uniref:dentin sialophosphoprotein-like n=1 Tax=Littorina saxatilis TaxID=31220 RepID=UPI0038B4B909